MSAGPNLSPNLSRYDEATLRRRLVAAKKEWADALVALTTSLIRKGVDRMAVEKFVEDEFVYMQAMTNGSEQ